MRFFPEGGITPISPADQARIHRAHARLIAGGAAVAPADREVRAIVRASWQRSITALGSPDAALAAASAAFTEPAGREGHPIAGALPVLRRLLAEPAEQAGMLMAVTDEHGRLLWVEGDRGTRERAARMAFLPGADWSEASMGTSAPGLAVLGQAAQISGCEHFLPAAHAWHCTAMPVRDPRGRLIGAVDLTGGAAAAAPHSLALLRAAVAAAEAELRIAELTADRAGARRRMRPSAIAFGAGQPAPVPQAAPSPARLRALGVPGVIVESPAGREELSGRHGEITFLLAWHRDGLSARELHAALLPEGTARQARPVTLRAEIARLRRVLSRHGIGIQARPYRLVPSPALDARDMLDAVDHGHHRRALELYAGSLLAASGASGIEALREEIDASLREQILSSGSIETLLRYAETPAASGDPRVLLELLRRLPARSPKRARVLIRLEALEQG